MIISKNCYKSLISNLNGNVKCLDKMHSVLSGLYYNTYVPRVSKNPKKISIFGNRMGQESFLWIEGKNISKYVDLYLPKKNFTFRLLCLHQLQFANFSLSKW